MERLSFARLKYYDTTAEECFTDHVSKLSSNVPVVFAALQDFDQSDYTQLCGFNDC